MCWCTPGIRDAVCGAVDCNPQNERRVKLLFMNPVFSEGLNVTCRKGVKWLHQTYVGHELAVEKTNTGAPVGRVVVVGVLSMPFSELPAELLTYEHDPACRTRQGLLQEMRRVYGKSFKKEDVVTVLVFKKKE